MIVHLLYNMYIYWANKDKNRKKLNRKEFKPMIEKILGMAKQNIGKDKRLGWTNMRVINDTDQPEFCINE